MTINFPLPTLKAQTNVTSYSRNPADHPTLEKLSNLLPALTQDALASLSIIALKEGYEPVVVQVDYGCGCNIFNRCIELIQELSQAGKVALVRSVAELLAVSLSLPTQPQEITLPPVLSSLTKGAEQ